MQTDTKIWMGVNKEIILTVHKCPEKRGYSIFHNQQIGWYGTTANWFGWYKYKSDAIKRACELMKCFNKQN